MKTYSIIFTTLKKVKANDSLNSVRHHSFYVKEADSRLLVK